MNQTVFYVELTDDGRYLVMNRRTNKPLPMRADLSRDEARQIVQSLNEEVKLGDIQM